jgi:hypothetical protein
MLRPRLLSCVALLALAALPARVTAQRAAPLPLKHQPRPTTAGITPADLMTRLYIFADDSMMGRETGTVGHVKSTDYIVSELKRLGLQPAGDDGGYIQSVPMIRRAFDPASLITVEGGTLHGGIDFVATTRGAIGSIDRAQVVFGGTALDTTDLLTPGLVTGKIVVVRAATGGGRGFGGRRGGGGALRAYFESLNGAAAIATIAEELSARQVEGALHPRDGDVLMKPADTATPGPLTLTITPQAAALLLGVSPDAATKGQLGKAVRATLIFHDQAAPARNVVAIVPGSDPALSGEYVAIGAHDDHVGLLQGQPIDHDSLHLYNAARFAVVGMVSRGQQATDEQQAQVAAIHVNVDSVRKGHRPRPDSIRNGADDDGSGSVTMLELAEAFAKTAAKPRRSILFVWHTGEEKGLLGSRWFTDHPTVPRDSIVAQLNMDMVGRGDARDIPVGGPDYLQLVGSRRLSTELGDLVETVNRAEAHPFKFDYQFDAAGHPENIYCRSDHYSYARYGIPIVFFTTGLHGDYHQVTDEPEYIDYQHMARVGKLVYDIALKVANLDHRPVVDQEEPDPNAPCRQ